MVRRRVVISEMTASSVGVAGAVVGSAAIADESLDLSLDDDLSFDLDYHEETASEDLSSEDDLELIDLGESDNLALASSDEAEESLNLSDGLLLGAREEPKELLPIAKENKTESPRPAKKSLSKEEAMPSRTELPEMLFYDIVSVSGTKEVVIPLSDSLATFTIETFAMSEGNWTQNQTTVVVDKPVRVDLELPLAVHPDDKVMGRLRTITTSRKARITLTHNGNRVAFESHLAPLLEKGEVVDTPVELEFIVKSGAYVSKVFDHLTGETDTTEMIVGEPGKLTSYVKELGFRPLAGPILFIPTHN